MLVSLTNSTYCHPFLRSFFFRFEKVKTDTFRKKYFSTTMRSSDHLNAWLSSKRVTLPKIWEFIANYLLLGKKFSWVKKTDNEHKSHLLFSKPYVWRNECIFGMSSSLQSQFGHRVQVIGARMSLYVLISIIRSIYSFKLANWLQLQHEFRGTCTWQKFEILTSDSGMLVLEW